MAKQKKNIIGFLMGMAFGFGMDSNDVESIMEKRGVDMQTATLDELKTAIRAHLGDEEYASGVARINKAAH